METETVLNTEGTPERMALERELGELIEFTFRMEYELELALTKSGSE